MSLYYDTNETSLFNIKGVLCSLGYATELNTRCS